MFTPVTPSLILGERNKKRLKGGWAHTPNVAGHAIFSPTCDCYNCRDYFDPTGEQDAAAFNRARETEELARLGIVQQPAGGAGFLPRADAVRPEESPLLQSRPQLPRADAVRPEESPQRPFMPCAERAFPPQLARADAINQEDPIVQMCRDAHLPLPPPPPVLERQNAVILGRAPEPMPPVDDARILEQMLARWRDQAEQARQNLERLGQPANNDQAAQITHLEARLNLLKAEQKVEKLNQLLLSLRPQI